MPSIQPGLGTDLKSLWNKILHNRSYTIVAIVVVAVIVYFLYQRYKSGQNNQYLAPAPQPGTEPGKEPDKQPGKEPDKHPTPHKPCPTGTHEGPSGGIVTGIICVPDEPGRDTGNPRKPLYGHTPSGFAAITGRQVQIQGKWWTIGPGTHGVIWGVPGKVSRSQFETTPIGIGQKQVLYQA